MHNTLCSVASADRANLHMQVVGFEQAAQPGGTWIYDANTDSDLLGAAANRRKAHGSMYRCGKHIAYSSIESQKHRHENNTVYYLSSCQALGAQQ